MSGCKAREVMRNEAYVLYAAKTNDERNPAMAGQTGIFQPPLRIKKTGADI